MSGDALRDRLLPVVAAFAAPALYGLLMRPRLLTWGATGDEASAAYPGDGLVPEPDGGATMATTFPAPPERVWPCLAQMGGHRGGWYSWDWLDNNGEPRAARIVPEWQSLEEGQHLHRVAAPKWQPRIETLAGGHRVSSTTCALASGRRLDLSAGTGRPRVSRSGGGRGSASSAARCRKAMDC
jgi:hypothetical protein